jgi:hypothetical protein
MSAHPPPPSTPTLDSKLPPYSYPSCRLSAVGCELRPLLKIFPVARTSPAELKSFICNAYEKHGGVGVGSPSNAMPPLPPRTLCLCVRLSCLSSPNFRLLAVSCKLPVDLRTFPAASTRTLKPKSFIRNAYKKHGEVGDASGTANLGCPSYVSLDLQVSTINLQPLPPVISRGSRNAGHGSRPHEPTHL